jgi:phage/plasmid-like protein (TIGR03299 family)
MSHAVETMMYTGDVPWHKLGVALPAAPTVEEGILAAGLDWEVGTKPLFTSDNEKVTHQATYRKTDGKILGVVGPTYKPLQNKEAFNFFNPFLESGAASLETAGSLHEGGRVWVLAKINKEDSVIVPKSNDTIKKYILLCNSHDGTLAIRVGFTPVRTVCQNTLNMALNDKASKLIRIRHTGDIVGNLDKVSEIMDAANAQFEATAEQFRRMANTEINRADLEKYVRIVFATKKQEEEALLSGEELTSGNRVMESVTKMFEHGRGNDMPGVKGTLWAAYNAVAEYVQYERGNDTATRLDNLWFGTGAGLNKKALVTALSMVKSA